MLGTGWANTEFRSYKFKDENGDNASMIETVNSRERRRGWEKPPDESEELELELVRTKSLEKERGKRST